MLGTQVATGVLVSETAARRWWTEAGQLLGLLVLLAPAVGYVGRSIMLSLVDPELPAGVLVASRSVRGLTVEGVAWLMLVVVTSAPAVILGWRVVRLHGLGTRAEGLLADVEEAARDLDSRVRSIRNHSALDPLGEEERARIEAAVLAGSQARDEQEALVERVRAHVADIREDIVRPWPMSLWLAAVVAGPLIWVWTVSWPRLLILFVASASSVPILNWLSRRRRPLRMGHLWLPVSVAAVAAVLLGVTGTPVGLPADLTFDSRPDGRYSMLERDDAFSYLWPCEDGADAEVVAVPTSQVRSITFPVGRAQHTTAVEALRGAATPMRPYIACGE